MCKLHLRLFAQKKQQLNEKAVEPIAHVWQSRKKRTSPSSCAIIAFFVATNLLKNLMNNKNIFWRICCCIFARVTHPCPLARMFGKLQKLVSHQCFHVLFFSWSFLVEEVLLAIVKKTMDHHVLLNLVFATIVSTNFDLWMFCGNVDIFALVINFFNVTWVPMHVTVKLFEVNETI